jgi:SulP family sulfate permease
LFECLRGYSREDFLADLIAGVTVGIIALSLSMALGIASERTPGVGIVTCIVAGFIVSTLSGSKVQIGGPTAAFIPVVVGVAHAYGASGLVFCTMLAGVFLIAMGLARFGVMIKYIPVPVVAGFTAGIAVYIFSTQVKDFLGLQTADVVPPEFIGKVAFLWKNATRIHWPTVAVGAGALAFIKLWPRRWGRQVPASIVAVALGTLAVAVFHLPVETIGARFGSDAIPRGLPAPAWPAFEWGQLSGLVRPAFTIALLAAIESLLCAVVADGMIEDKHDSNTELIAQGIANIGSALFGGLPATGALARTAANVRSGGRTPVAGIIHAATVLCIALAAAPLAHFIPLPVLSAVLLVVALNMGEWHHFARLRRWPTSDSVVYVITFSLTVLTDITVAVEVGMVLAAVLFIRRIAETTKLTSVDDRELDYDPQHSLHGKMLPPRVAAFQLMGALMFGAADRLETALRGSNQRPRVVVLGMQRVLALDATGLHALEEFEAELRYHGAQLLIAGAHTQPLMSMAKAGFVGHLGEENFCANMDAALARARSLVEGSDPEKDQDAPPAPATGNK